ncbi:MAG: hypothetical protein ACE5FJ_07860, partial [Gemmatimonadales bacterium]
RAMTAASELGAVIVPPVPAFYANPRSLEDMIDHTIGRVLDLFDIESGLVASAHLNPDAVAFGDFSAGTNVAAGNTWYNLISGANRPATAVKFRDNADQPLPSTFTLWIMRTR